MRDVLSVLSKPGKKHSRAIRVGNGSGLAQGTMSRHKFF